MVVGEEVERGTRQWTTMMSEEEDEVEDWVVLLEGTSNEVAKLQQFVPVVRVLLAKVPMDE